MRCVAQAEHPQRLTECYGGPVDLQRQSARAVELAQLINVVDPPTELVVRAQSGEIPL